MTNVIKYVPANTIRETLSILLHLSTLFSDASHILSTIFLPLLNLMAIKSAYSNVARVTNSMHSNNQMSIAVVFLV